VAPSLSLVIEWENANRIGVERARRMLAALHEQLREVGAPGRGEHEVFLLFPEDDVSDAELRPIVEEVAPIDSWPARFRLVPSTAGGYYEQKNAGAALTSGDILIFLDSDVVPQPGWLAGLIDGLQRSNASVVCGNTFVEYDGVYSAAVALSWFFPLRSEEEGLKPTHFFYANNVAFRRDVFMKHQFPETGQFRGQCSALAVNLERDGHQIVMNGASRVAHPPPEGLKHYAVRALWNGHDDFISMRNAGNASFLGGSKKIARDLRWTLQTIKRDHPKVGFGLAGAAVAGSLAAVYCGLKWMSYTAAIADDRKVYRTLEKVDG
jgi:hypothetical protein